MAATATATAPWAAALRAAVADTQEPPATAFERHVLPLWKAAAPTAAAAAAPAAPGTPGKSAPTAGAAPPTTAAAGKPAEDRRRTLAELAFRIVLQELTEERITAATFPPLERTLDMALYASSKGYLGDVVMLLIEDILEVQTIPSCELVFGYLESRMAQLTQGMQPGKGRGLALLRLSNELLRRLSKTTHTAFGGRIRMFLANAFPLSERSGLNLAGTFNVDNTTLVDPPPADGEADEDYDLYARFWSLQSYLANPRLCMDAAGWLKFATAVETVLSLFEKEVFEQKRGATASTTSPSLPPTLAAAMAPTDFLFCPKFLTSRKLFRLQLRDPTVQRQILMQILIIADFLSTFSAAARAKLASVPNKGPTQPNVTLSESQIKAVEAIRDRAMKQFSRLPPDGPGFADLVRRILERELPWIAWKLDSCPPFEKEPVDASGFVPKKRRREDAGDGGRLDLGSDRLTALWNAAPDTDGFLRDPERRSAKRFRLHSVPTTKLEDFLSKLETEMLPENAIETDYRSSRNTVYVWRAVRLITRVMLDKFNNIPLVEASSDGRVVKVPDLETFLQRLKAPPAPADAAKPAGSPAPAADSPAPGATPPPPPASGPEAPAPAKESPAAGTPSGAGTPGGGGDVAAEPGADGAVDPVGSSSAMAVDAAPAAPAAADDAPAPQA